MPDNFHQARVIALSLAQCDTLVEFLRANGRPEQAAAVEVAMHSVADLMAEAVGRAALDDALTWVRGELGIRSHPFAAAGPLH